MLIWRKIRYFLISRWLHRGFARQLVLRGRNNENILHNKETFFPLVPIFFRIYCSYHATWLPYKTSIAKSAFSQEQEVAHAQLRQLPLCGAVNHSYESNRTLPSDIVSPARKTYSPVVFNFNSYSDKSTTQSSMILIFTLCIKLSNITRLFNESKLRVSHSIRLCYNS